MSCPMLCHLAVVCRTPLTDKSLSCPIQTPLNKHNRNNLWLQHIGRQANSSNSTKPQAGFLSVWVISIRQNRNGFGHGRRLSMPYLLLVLGFLLALVFSRHILGSNQFLHCLICSPLLAVICSNISQVSVRITPAELNTLLQSPCCSRD